MYSNKYEHFFGFTYTLGLIKILVPMEHIHNTIDIWFWSMLTVTCQLIIIDIYLKR